MSKQTAAILIPIVKTGGIDQILFEKRASTLEVQPGDICFPGGGIEDGEESLDAVIRETCEELLIEPDEIRDIEYFGEKVGPGGHGLVAIFVGEVVEYYNTYSADEVESVFCVPIEWFDKNIPQDTSAPEYRYGRYRIWGFTARVLQEFLENRRK